MSGPSSSSNNTLNHFVDENFIQYWEMETAYFSHHITLLNIEDHHFPIRSHIVRLIKLYSGLFFHLMLADNLPTIRERVHHMNKPYHVWGTHREIKEAATLFQLPIYLCTQSKQSCGATSSVFQQSYNEERKGRCYSHLSSHQSPKSLFLSIINSTVRTLSHQSSFSVHVVNLCSLPSTVSSLTKPSSLRAGSFGGAPDEQTNTFPPKGTSHACTIDT